MRKWLDKIVVDAYGGFLFGLAGVNVVLVIITLI